MRTSLAFLLIGLLSLGGARAGPFDFSNVISSVKDVTTGVAKDVATNLLPTPKGLFETSKQLVAGYPFEFVYSSINKICSSALSSDSINPRITPDIEKMNFQREYPFGKFASKGRNLASYECGLCDK